jgi:hypothetical protein
MCRELNLHCPHEDSEGFCILPYGEERCPDLQGNADKVKALLEEYHSRGEKEKRKGKIITLDDIRKGRVK